LQADDLGQVLSQALGDKDEDVRRRAVWAVAGRAAAVRMHATLPGEAEVTETKEMVERWRMERATLLNLRNQVTAAVSDNIPTVRDGAIVALCSLDYEPGMPVPNFQLRPETMQILADAYGRETSIKVRTQIVKTFALTPTNSPLREALLMQALNDSMPSVLQFAAMGAGEAHLAAALPRLAELLGHSNRAVRLNVVQAIAMQGKLAAPYRERLQQALNAESDEIVRKTIEGALSTLPKGD
jgi:HEAT repeat protein